jgi:hypothetical protein
MKKEKLEKEAVAICWGCYYYYQSEGGCVEGCRMAQSEPYCMRPYYAERLNGEKSNCKDFKKMIKEI